MSQRPRIVQAGAPLDLRGSAGAPFSLTLDVTVEPDTVVLSGWEVEATVAPTVTFSAGSVVVEWSAEQTAAMGSGARPWALTCLVDGQGPHPVVAGSVWMAPITRPGEATSVEADLAVSIGQSADLSISATLGSAGGRVDQVQAGTAITVDATDPVRPVVGVTPGTFDPAGSADVVAQDLDAHKGLTTTAHGGIVSATDPRLSDARTPTTHGNEAHSSSFVDAAGAAAAAPVQSVQGQTGAVVLDAAGVGAVPASTLTTDGDLLTRAGGVPARIARADLAADPAFSSRYAPLTAGLSGSGSPEGVVTAAVGAVYRDLAATNGAILWVKATGTGNTGWQVAYGNTGRRDVTALLLNGWTANVRVSLQRRNNHVEVQVDQLKSDTASDNTLLEVPAGFRASSPWGGWFPMTNSGHTPVFMGLFFDNTLRCPRSEPTLYGTGIWTTNNAWPSSLPGTAI